MLDLGYGDMFVWHGSSFYLISLCAFWKRWEMGEASRKIKMKKIEWGGELDVVRRITRSSLR